MKVPVKFSNETYNEAYNKINQFLAGNQDYDDFVKNAEDNGYRLLSREGFRSDEHVVGGVPGSTEACAGYSTPTSTLFPRCTTADVRTNTSWSLHSPV